MTALFGGVLSGNLGHLADIEASAIDVIFLSLPPLVEVAEVMAIDSGGDLDLLHERALVFKIHEQRFICGGEGFGEFAFDGFPRDDPSVGEEHIKGPALSDQCLDLRHGIFRHGFGFGPAVTHLKSDTSAVHGDGSIDREESCFSPLNAIDVGE